MASSTWRRPKLFYHTVTAAEQTVSGVTFQITSGASVEDFYFVSQLQRSGLNITANITHVYTSGDGTMTISGPVNTDDEVRILGTFI